MDFDTYKADMDKKMEEKFVDTDGVEKLKYPLSSQEQLKREHELVKKIIEEGKEKGFISEDDARLALPSEPKPGRLYGNPKDHKQCNPETGQPPLREVVSNSGSNTQNLGKICTHFIRPVNVQTSSFI